MRNFCAPSYRVPSATGYPVIRRPYSALRDWSGALKLATRFDSTTTPTTYDAASHSVDAVISSGAPVRRFYGTEVLRISKSAVDLSRLRTGIPLLDSHNQISITHTLGRLTDAWIDGRKLFGSLRFSQTYEGRIAERMVARGDLFGISAGYRVEEWSAQDEDGEVIKNADPNRAGWDSDITYTAERWQLFEVSLVTVPADHSSGVY
jgi:hypothetical protein